MAITREVVLSFVNRKGPLQPIDVKRELGGDTIIIGAILSELASSGSLKITSVKRGGSPFYHTPSQKSLLINLIKFLNEKDRETANLLKSEQILEDKTQTPLVRVSLRNIKDFSVPIYINVNNEKILYWKWFLFPNDQAAALIKKKYYSTNISTKNTSKKIPEKESAVSQNNNVKKAVKKEVKQEERKEKIEKKQQKEKDEPKKQIKSLKQVKLAENNKEKNKISQDQEDISSPFIDKIENFLRKNKIEIESKNIVRKASDIEYTVNIPSAVGEVKYFCKARSKKKANEGDLSSAYVKGELNKLPVLFIVTGEVTKKAKAQAEKDFKNMKIIELK